MDRKVIRKEARRLFDAKAPDKFTADAAFLDDIEKELVEKIDDKDAYVRATVRQIIDDVQETSFKRANRHASKFNETGQLSLIDADAFIVVGENRVRLGAAASRDLRKSAADERRVGAKVFAGLNSSCEGKEALADLVDETEGAETVEDVLPDED